MNKYLHLIIYIWKSWNYERKKQAYEKKSIPFKANLYIVYSINKSVLYNLHNSKTYRNNIQ